MKDQMELQLKYRPTDFNEVVGQSTAVATLKKMVEEECVPHAIMLYGPSGVGKTTVARLMQRHLDCRDADYNEINTASSRGIDTIRDIQSVVSLRPMGGSSRIWVLDEIHGVTGVGQDALLKLLEDCPRHVYFFLCTTDPNKLKATIHTRCTKIELKPLSQKHLVQLLKRVLGWEEMEVAEEVLLKIVEIAEGSARDALVMLNQVYRLSPEEQLEAVVSPEADDGAKKLLDLLLNPKMNDWLQIVQILKKFEEDPESTRCRILSYAAKVMLNKPGPMVARACLVVNAFRDPLYSVGKAGLIAACFEVFAKKG